MELQTISTVSKSLNISTRTLRYYEQLGLIQSVKKEGYAYRTYDEGSLARLEQIIILRKLRIPLKQIQLLLQGDESAVEIKIFQDKINELSEEINTLATIRTILNDFVSGLKKNYDVKISERLLADKIDSLTMTKINFKEEINLDEAINGLRLREFSEKPERINFLDTTQSLVVFLTILFHTTFMYVPMFQFMPFVKNTLPRNNSIIYYIITLVCNNDTLYSVLFFIAGYFSLCSLIRKGSIRFLKDKLIRLGIPYIFGIIFLSPVCIYISLISFGYHINFFEYWFPDSFLPPNITPLQLWFPGILLCCFIIFGMVFMILTASGRISSFKIQPGRPSVRFFAAYISMTAVLYFISGLCFDPANFTSLYLVNFQTIKILLYISYFLLGIYAYKKDWFNKGYMPEIIPWSAFFAMTIALYVIVTVFNERVLKIIQSPILLLFITDSLLTISIFAAIMMILGVCRKFFNHETPFSKAVFKSSYGAYIVSFLAVYGLIYLTRDIPLPQFLRYAIQLILSVSLSFGAGFVLKKIPVLKNVL